jgi:hypothetical protein
MQAQSRSTSPVRKLLLAKTSTFVDFVTDSFTSGKLAVRFSVL